jgi:hypothetical protein
MYFLPSLFQVSVLNSWNDKSHRRKQNLILHTGKFKSQKSSRTPVCFISCPGTQFPQTPLWTFNLWKH